MIRHIMEKKPIITLWQLMLFLTLAASCDSDQSPDCFKQAGKEVTHIHDIGASFNELYFDGKIRVQLKHIPGIVPYAEIQYRQNLVSKVRFSIVNQRLTISDDNKCQFVRDFKYYPTITLYVNDELRQIHMEGYTFLNSVDTLFIPNIYIFNHGLGDVDLTLGGTLGIECNGYGGGRFTIRGKTGYMAATMDDICTLDSKELELDDLYLFHYSLLSSTVGSKEVMHLYLFGQGDIWLHEFPNDESRDRCCDVITERTGKGNIIFP